MQGGCNVDLRYAGELKRWRCDIAGVAVSTMVLCSVAKSGHLGPYSMRSGVCKRVVESGSPHNPTRRTIYEHHGV